MGATLSKVPCQRTRPTKVLCIISQACVGAVWLVLLEQCIVQPQVFKAVSEAKHAHAEVNTGAPPQKVSADYTDTTEDRRLDEKGNPHLFQENTRGAHRDIICPAIGTLINQGALEVKQCYTREELKEVFIKAGLDPQLAETHSASNFKNFPAGHCMNVFKMEGQGNEHDFSTGGNDCPTSFTKCFKDKDTGIPHCTNQTDECTKPNRLRFEEFVDVVDADKDGWITRQEFIDADTNRLIPFNDNNPFGLGTISGSHILLIDTFIKGDRISVSDLTRITLLRKFPLQYRNPFEPAVLVSHVLEPDPSKVRALVQMYEDRSGNENKISHASHVLFNGADVRLDAADTGFDIAHDKSLNFGEKSFTVMGWVKLEDIQSTRSSFIMKKGKKVYNPPGKSGWTAGWQLGIGEQFEDPTMPWIFQDGGIGFTARDTDSTTIDGRRCKGLLKFDNNVTWSAMLNQWCHIAVLFDRELSQVILYLNGGRQQEHLSLHECAGSWENTEKLEIGHVDGWRTVGALKSFKIFDGKATDSQIADSASMRGK